jgi:uncharacterized repeat protein (TIGR01451 family)
MGRVKRITLDLQIIERKRFKMKAYFKGWLTVLALALGTLAIIILATQPTRAAGPWYVAPGGSDSNSCLSPGAACATINGAIAKASPGDMIYVATGTYTGTGNEVVSLDKDVTLSGGWDGIFITQSGTSTIDGEDARRGNVVNSGVTAMVERFTIQNGFTPGNGGGIRNIGGILTLNNSAVSGNTAGGVSGGGIANQDNGALTLNNSTVSNNTAPEAGGGIANYATLILNDSTVSNNTATDDGGGISNRIGTATLNNSTVSGNTARNSGGIFNKLYVGGGTVTLNNSTVSGNTATGFAVGGGGGIRNEDGTVTLQNSILAGNMWVNRFHSDCSGTIDSVGYNLIGDTSGCTFTPTSGDLTNTDPLLGPLEGSPGYHPLLSGSPAIDAGNPAGCTDHLGNPLLTDQRGMPRVGRCDIGAYELSLTAKQADGTYTPGTSLTYMITFRNEADSDITGVLITDTLPISLTYVAGSFSATNGVGGESGGVITWTGTVPAGGSTTISFRATIDNDMPSCSLITNKATIGGQGYEVERQVTGATPCVCNLTKEASNPVLSVGAGGSWDDDGVWGPAVLKEGSSYRMWYTGDDGSGPSQIGLATSTNGINWTKEAANPVLSPGQSWEAEGIRAASVISDSGLYKMWYTGRDSSGVRRIGYATSPDGVTWTKDGSNPVLDVGASGSWEDEDVSGPTVIKEGGTYHLWYTGDDGITPRIGHATSSDGIHWTKDSANPVLDIGPPGDWDWLYVYGPNVVAYGGTYLLWYSGGTLPSAWQTGYALSSNGSSWTRGEMLIPEGAPGTFDAHSADYPSVIVDGTGFKVWYSGLNDGGTYNIGYATGEICSGPSPEPPANPIYLPIVMRGWNPQYPCPAYYTDDFSDPDSGWPVGEDSKYAYGYISGQYQIRVKSPPGGFQVTPGAKATDFAAAVSARRTSGTYGAYGIHFGINEDWSQYYEVVIDANYYSIWRYDGTWTPLRDWTTSGYINTGTSWNRLKVIRDGANIAVYVNNKHLATVTDSSFTGLRRIGLYAGSGSALDARFDDFSLYPASCGPSAAGVGFEMGEPGIHEMPMAPGLDQSP